MEQALSFLSECISQQSLKCDPENSYFAFIMHFLLSNNECFSTICQFCPFSYCYRYFMLLASAFQIAVSLQELFRILKVRGSDELLVTIPFLDIPISQHNFDLIQNSLNVSSHVDLVIRAVTSESAPELVTFTAISFGLLVYSLVCYVIKYENLTQEKKIVQFIMNMAAILNLAFLMCFIFERCKHGTYATQTWYY